MAQRATRAARLRSYLELVTGSSGGLEALEVPRSALESAIPGEAQAASTARRGLDKLRSRKAPPLAPDEAAAMEAIILPDLRPAIDIVDGSFRATHLLWTKLNRDPAIESRLKAAIPAIGRIGLPGQDRIPYAGTGFLVGPGLLMTNRHVASIFASGMGLRDLAFKPGWRADVDLLRERGREATELLTVTAILMIHPWWDMALLKVEGPAATRGPLRLSLAEPAALVGREVAVIGYPAHDPQRNDPAIQAKLFDGVYGVKRLQPGKLAAPRQTESYGKNVEAATHDASTLGGNSGSALIDLATGEVVGLHFGGRFLDINFAVPAGALARDGRVVDAGVTFAGNAPGGTPAWAGAWQGLEAGSPAKAGAAPAPAAAPASTTVPVSATRDVLLRVRLGADGRVSAELIDPAEGLAEALAEPVRDGNYRNRRGYRVRYLRHPVPLPRVADPSLLAPLKAGGTLLHYQHFSIAMHAARRLALFTAANLSRDPALRRPDPARATTRRALSGLGPGDQEKWFTDPRLDERFQIPDAFYTLDRGAFDKGHIVRREDAAWGRTHAELLRANGDTYHVTNCSPQVASFNRSVLGRDNWGDLEDFLFARAASARMSLFAGPLLSPDDPLFLGTAGGRAALAVRVPRAFWKVAVTEVADGTGLAAYAFLLSQDLSAVPLEFAVPPGLREQMVPLADLEMKTGLIFPAILHAADQFDETRGAELAQATGIERVWLDAGGDATEAVARYPGDDEAAPARRPAAALEGTEEAPRPWRLAQALKKLRDQVNARYPHRSRTSDGSIGDAAHASRASDHNPWVVDGPNGVVTAIDITHDPASGCDAGALAAALVASRDPRIKYVIWNRRIANHAAVGHAPAWAWRPYGGSNPHTHHVHISVRPEKARYDSLAPWAI